MSVELLNSNQTTQNENNNFSNTDAELAVISCILWDNKNYEKISDFLNETHFVDETNKIIFSTIKSLLDKNILVSPITLKNYLPEENDNLNKSNNNLNNFAHKNNIRTFEHDPRIGGRFSIFSITALLPILALVIVVIGSMYFGWATATEAAAVGVVGALTLAFSQGSLNWETFSNSLMGATRTSAMIALILMGAAFLSLSMGFTGLPRALANYIDSLNLSPIVLIASLTVFYIILGMFLDGISSVVLTMAIVEPMIRQAGIDVIWFGIFVVVVVEMAQVTPPIGFNLFVLQGMTKHEISYIAKTAIPMVALMILMVIILVIWPELATWLPETIRQGGS